MRPATEVDQFQHPLHAFQTFAEFQASIFEAGQQHLDILDGLRSVCWKIFLLFRDVDQAQWLSSLTKSRSAYDALRTHYLRAIQNPDEVESSADDPLSENVEYKSPWSALQQDEAIRQEIFQDVERCMPENTYFRQPETQNLMLDILFVYTKLNKDIGYRQGMHELLAFVLWAVERDAVRADEQSQMLHQVVDARYIEHDSFTLFAEIMRNAKSFYDPAGVGSQPGAGNSGQYPENESAMIQRSRRIFSTLLPQYDPGLAAHLEELDISPQLFLMRWIRLLFGREFPFDDTLQVWDLLFADDPTLELIDYICIAMLLRIRWQLVDADTNEALMLLMRYPSTPKDHAPRSFVLDARYLRATPSVETGNDLIKKYSDRVPLPFKPRPQRPSTPEFSATPGTPQSHRSRSPFVTAGLPTSLDSLFNDAARGVLNRGEKWGLNQAVRDAVGEVRKNVQNLQSSRGSPRGPGLIGHRSSRSSETAGTIAANVLRKLTAVEQRNKHLALMLEAAVGELWSAEKEVAGGVGGEETTQRLSMAIAKVQFVQVFLQDSTLPLPQEEEVKIEDTKLLEGDEEVTSLTARGQGDTVVTTVQVTSDPGTTQSPSLAPSPIPAIVRPRSTASPPPVLPTTSITTQHVSATAPSILKAPLDALANQKPATPQPGTSPNRPRIEQSSYSWMLGQENSTSSSSDFVRASPFGVTHEKRRPKDKDKEKGFLFGEDADVVGERRVVKGRTVRKGSRDIRRGGRASPAPGELEGEEVEVLDGKGEKEEAAGPI